MKNQKRFPFQLELISGQRIERSIINFAQIGGTKIKGTKELPERYSVSRLALSDADFAARKLLTGMMEGVGLTSIVQHPLGIVGYFQGENQSLPPIIIESHFDSVPEGGMYDGTVGIMTGLEILKFFKQNNIKVKRTIVLIALTGEESSGFNIGLFGSRGIALGLTEDELNQGKSGGKTIRQTLEHKGLSIDMVRTPYHLNRESPVIEVHVAQDDRLIKSNIDLAIVTDIAAPRRFQVTIGSTKLALQKESTFAHSSYFSIRIDGKAGHSGATPMGRDYRADGFVAMSDILTNFQKIRRQVKRELGQNIELSIGRLMIEEQAMNKIPGIVFSQLRISASEQKTVSFTEKLLRDFVLKKNIEYSKQPIFNKNPIKMSKLNKIQASEVFYDSEEILKRHLYVGEIVKQINRTGNKQQYRKVKNVGTVGTYRCDEGQIVLAIDMRGINKTLRNKMISEITYKLDILKEKNEIDYKELAGGGDPVAMDPKLVDLAYRVVKENNIGRVVKDFSPAGQDSQNFARAGHPAVMIFIPSRNGGIAHTPEEYSTPKDLQRGAQALAGLVYNLATTL